MRRVVWLGIIWALAESTACRAPGERVTVVYRGDSGIEPKGGVYVGREAVGFVERVEAGAGATRVTLLVREAARLHRADRLVPIRRDGRVGLQVIGGGGDPLLEGDTLEAGFAPVAVPPASPALAAPAGAVPAHDTPPHQWLSESARPREDFSRFEKVDPELRRRVESLRHEAAALSSGDAAVWLTEQKQQLDRTFDDQIRASYQKGDHEAVRELKVMHMAAERDIRRLQAQTGMPH